MRESKSIEITIDSISIGNKMLIENLDIRLDPGTIQLLKAPNGTGKSVLMSILAGADEPIDHLSISSTYSNGCESYRIPQDSKPFRKHAKHRIGYLSHRLFEESLAVTFAEEICFITQKYAALPEEIKSAIDYLKAHNEAGLKVENMSKGHRQLMALADVISEYQTQELILLDEPTSYLSDENFQLFLQQLYFITQNSSCRVLIASNDDRLFNKGFAEISLPTRGKKALPLPLTLPSFPSVNSLSVRVQGTPAGQAGKLPFRFDEQIGEQESVLVTGANGSGKTTFLRVCAGLMPIKGKVEYACGPTVIKKRQLFPEYMSFLFQEPLNYEFRYAVEEILRKPARLSGYHHLDSLYEDILAYYDIPKTQDPKTLSSGQLRMLWLVSMLGWSGRWLLDEPDSSLDARSTDLFLSLLDMHLASGGTVIIVTHNPGLYSRYHFRTIAL